MSLVGHEEVRHRLESPPQVSLIRGPEGVGKRLVAREAAQRVAAPAHVIEVGLTVCTQKLASNDSHNHHAVCEVMTRRVAEYVVDRCRVRVSGRAVVFDAGQATQEAANSLLKILEEPPKDTYFFMYASDRVLPTLRSRAEQMLVTPLADEEVVSLLVARGVPRSRAELAAKVAGGRPGRAFTVEQELQQHSLVCNLLSAVQSEDRSLMRQTLAGLLPKNDEEWAEYRSTGDIRRSRQAVALLRVALVECRSHHWVAFRESEVHEVDQLPSKELDRAISACGKAARSALVSQVVVERLMHAHEVGGRRR